MTRTPCWFEMVVRGAASAAVQLRVRTPYELLLMHMSNDKHITPLGMSSNLLIKSTVRQLATAWYLLWLCGQGPGNDLVICALTGFAKSLH